MNISSASLYDHISLYAETKSLFTDRYNCDKEHQVMTKQINNYKGNNKEYLMKLKENIALRKVQKSCGYVSKKLIDEHGNIKYYTCLCKIKHPYFSHLMGLVDAYDNGLLPFEGGVMDQPAQIIELIQTAKNIKIELMAEKQKEQNGRKSN